MIDAVRAIAIALEGLSNDFADGVAAPPGVT